MTRQIDFPKDIDNTNQPATASETFSWTKQWYPLAVVEFLDPTRPHPIQLLGKDVVLWRDGEGKWRCFDDACPHRLAPFSEGRVEADGTLLCAYHAWRFDGEGNCVRIPQSQDPATEAKHCANPKSCAVAYPTQECQGLLWVWAESGREAQQESESKSPRLIPELASDSERVVQLFWNIRDLPYGWDFFMENVSDPAHVPVSHHGIMGSRYTDAKYYDMVRVREMSAEGGFSYATTPTPATIAEAIHDFQPPCLMQISSRFTDGGMLILVLYATPTRPGWCRHIGCQILVKNDAGKLPPGLGFFALPMPVWVGHILASLFLHQDMVFLHYQEKTIAKHGQKRWLDAVYTPNPQDKMVIALRQWLQRRAGGGVSWAPGVAQLPSAERDKQKLFDVWTTHTKHCAVCQKALKRINRLSVAAYVAAIVCFGFGAMVNSGGISGVTIGAMMGAILFAIVGYLLKRLSRLFYVYEFEHAQND